MLLRSPTTPTVSECGSRPNPPTDLYPQLCPRVRIHTGGKDHIHRHLSKHNTLPPLPFRCQHHYHPNRSHVRQHRGLRLRHSTLRLRLSSLQHQFPVAMSRKVAPHSTHQWYRRSKTPPHLHQSQRTPLLSSSSRSLQRGCHHLILRQYLIFLAAQARQHGWDLHTL